MDGCSIRSASWIAEKSGSAVDGVDPTDGLLANKLPDPHANLINPF
jgi:hypothetical protein